MACTLCAVHRAQQDLSRRPQQHALQLLSLPVMLPCRRLGTWSFITTPTHRRHCEQQKSEKGLLSKQRHRRADHRRGGGRRHQGRRRRCAAPSRRPVPCGRRRARHASCAPLRHHRASASAGTKRLGRAIHCARRRHHHAGAAAAIRRRRGRRRKRRAVARRALDAQLRGKSGGGTGQEEVGVWGYLSALETIVAARASHSKN